MHSANKRTFEQVTKARIHVAALRQASEVSDISLCATPTTFVVQSGTFPSS